MWFEKVDRCMKYQYECHYQTNFASLTMPLTSPSTRSRNQCRYCASTTMQHHQHQDSTKTTTIYQCNTLQYQYRRKTIQCNAKSSTTTLWTKYHDPMRCNAIHYYTTLQSNRVNTRACPRSMDHSASQKLFWPVSAPPASQLLRRFGHPTLEVHDGMPEAAPSPPAPQQRFSGQIKMIKIG